MGKFLRTCGEVGKLVIPMVKDHVPSVSSDDVVKGGQSFLARWRCYTHPITEWSGVGTHCF